MWQDVLERFMADPFPSDGSSEKLPFPYPAGTFGHISGPFWFTFQQLNDEVVWIAYIDFRPPATSYRSFTR